MRFTLQATTRLNPVGSFDGRDVLIITSWFTGRVQFIDPATGNVLRNESGFATPYGAVLLEDGSLLVAEAAAKRITRLDAAGTREVFADGFEFPVGMALATNGILYLTDADAAAGAVMAVDMETRNVRTVTDGLRRPEGITVLPNGTLAVVDSAARVVYGLDPVSGIHVAFATGLNIGLRSPDPLPETWIFNGIVAAPDGTLYLPSDIETSLIALEPTGGGEIPTEKTQP